MKYIIVILFGFCLTYELFGQTDYSKVIEGTKPFVLGVIDELQSVELGEKRMLNIYLPEGYNQQDTITYPVIYLLDGSADEDFIHVAGLVQYNTFPWVNRMPKSILVGIATVDRRRDFTFPTTIEEEKKKFPTTGHSDKFISFLINELQPYIEKKYKTNTKRTLVGQSLGGLLATEILLKHPEMFSNYLIISPSLWWDDASLLEQPSALLEAKFTQPIRIYIGVGKEGLAPSTNPHVQEVDANLLAEKLKKGKSPSVKIFFDYLPEEDHSTIGHRAIENGFKWLFKDYFNKN